MDTKVKALVAILIAVTFLSLGIAYAQYGGLAAVLAHMSG
jgi:hypothetical protein